MSLWSRIPLIIAGSYPKAVTARKKAQANIVRRAMEKSRVATGAMRGGWQDEDIEPLEGIVYNLVEHTIHNEYGTIFMSAQPMLRPAIEETQPEFEDDLAEIYR